MDNLIVTIEQWLTTYGFSVIGAIIILVVGWLVARFIRKVVQALMTRAKMDQIIVSFASSLTYVALMVFVIIAALGKLGVPTASFITVVGAAGLAIGFALQGGLANFAAGVLIAIFRPFKVGHYIEAGGAAGIVEHIEIFTTTLRTPDNKEVILPNGKVLGDNITNYTAKETRRVDLVIGVSYGDDLDKVRTVVLDVLKGDERVLEEPEPTVAVVELADSSVNFVVRPWVKTADYWDAYFGITKAIKQRFDAEGISIPFPQRDVHMYQPAAQ